MFQIGHTMAIGNVIHRIIYELNSYYSNDAEISFFDFVYKDIACGTAQSEESSQKSLSNYFIIESETIEAFSIDFSCEHKLYMVLSSLFPSGFYFSLIQPPD